MPPKMQRSLSPPRNSNVSAPCAATSSHPSMVARRRRGRRRTPAGAGRRDFLVCALEASIAPSLEEAPGMEKMDADAAVGRSGRVSTPKLKTRRQPIAAFLGEAVDAVLAALETFTRPAALSLDRWCDTAACRAPVCRRGNRRAWGSAAVDTGS